MLHRKLIIMLLLGAWTLLIAAMAVSLGLESVMLTGGPWWPALIGAALVIPVLVVVLLLRR